MRVTLALCLVAVWLTSCGGAEDAGAGTTSVVSVVYPLTFVAERIAGSHADVTDLTPAGQEPHDIELSSDQIVAVAESDLLLYIGSDFQPALEDAVPEAGGETLDALEVVTPLETEGTADPHVWLDPLRLADIATRVAAALADLQPDAAEAFRDNGDDLVADLTELDGAFESRLADCDSRELVTAHEAFAYLANRYGLDQVGIAGIDPEAEPSPQRLVEVADFVRENDVQTIFFEELVSPAVAETIASETKARTAALNPLESPPEQGDYISAMRANLEALQDGLGCK